MEPTEKKDKWDILKIIGTVIIVPVIMYYTSHTASSFTNAIKAKENNLELLKLAVDILKQEPEKTDKNIRKWAIKVVNRYSEEKLDKDTQKSLEKNIFVPVPTNLTFDIGLSYPDKDKVHLMITNGTGSNIAITNVNIHGNKDVCKMDIIEDNVAGTFMSSLIDFGNKADLVKCLDVNQEIQSSYSLNNISLDSSISFFTFNKIKEYSSRSIPFEFTISYQSDNYVKNKSVRAYLHYYKEH